MRRVHVTDQDQIVVFDEDEKTLFDNFRRFHRENPQVYRILRRLSRKWITRHPGKKIGIRLLFEVARWETALETEGEPLKLNNNYCPFYARMLMRRVPELEDVFVIRRQRRGRDR